MLLRRFHRRGPPCREPGRGQPGRGQRGLRPHHVGLSSETARRRPGKAELGQSGRPCCGKEAWEKWEGMRFPRRDLPGLAPTPRRTRHRRRAAGEQSFIDTAPWTCGRRSLACCPARSEDGADTHMVPRRGHERPAFGNGFPRCQPTCPETL